MKGTFLSGGEVDLAHVDPGDGAGIETGKHELFAYDGGLGADQEAVEQEEDGECEDEADASHIFKFL